MDHNVSKTEYIRLVRTEWKNARLKVVKQNHETAWYYKGVLIAVYNEELKGGGFIFTTDSIFWT
jgi:hypothetical protein